MHELGYIQHVNEDFRFYRFLFVIIILAIEIISKNPHFSHQCYHIVENNILKINQNITSYIKCFLRKIVITLFKAGLMDIIFNNL